MFRRWKIFRHNDGVSARKIHYKHIHDGLRKWDSNLLEFSRWITLLSVSKCSIFSIVVVWGFSTRCFNSERKNDEENLFFSPSFNFHETLQFSWNDINLCRKGDSSFRRKCTLSVKRRGLKSKIMSQWMRRCRFLSLAFVLMSSSRW